MVKISSNITRIDLQTYLTTVSWKFLMINGFSLCDKYDTTMMWINKACVIKPKCPSGIELDVYLVVVMKGKRLYESDH